MNRNDWFAWRAKGIGASDAPIIMGVSPWKSRKQLWKEKTGLVATDTKSSNWAIDRGNRLEPLARAHYELMVGWDAPPMLVEHARYPFIRASLDGYNSAQSTVLEIKCPGQADHEKAINGKVPIKYYAQLQHQLFVTGARMAHYFSFDGHNGVIVNVPPDLVYITALVDQLISFWDAIQTKQEPGPIESIAMPPIAC